MGRQVLLDLGRFGAGAPSDAAEPRGTIIDVEAVEQAPPSKPRPTDGDP